MIAYPNDLDTSSIVYLNGEFVPLIHAYISPLDRGFLFSDGVYEVVPVYNGSAFFLKMHFNRLKRSLSSIQLEIDFDIHNFHNIVNQLVSKNVGENQIIYLQITRGVAKRNHAFPDNSSNPTIFAMSNSLVRPTSDERDNGVAAITSEDLRWNRCEIKSISLLANVLARQKAITKKATEAILIKDKKLQEGAASNIWIVKNSNVYIPPTGSNILEGIRVGIIEAICDKLKIIFKRKNISYNELMKADEVFLTSATKEILAITMIDDKKIGNANHNNKPGPIFKKIRFEYDELISEIKNNI